MIGTPTYKVTARLIDGEASVNVTAFCDYGNRSVSVSRDIEATSAVESALKKVLTADLREELGQEAAASAMKAFVVANEKGEKL